MKLIREIRTRLLTGAAVATVGLGLGLTSSALAQDNAGAEDTGGLDEIVVTAQHREERMQDVPIAISAVTAASLKDNGIDSSRDLPMIVPSVQFTRSGASGLFFVRGVGTTNAAVGEEGANAIYVDGVYLSDLSQAINNFNSIERIEVLKGPQGTLFGRNATGGLIHIITREPGTEKVLSGQVGYGNFGTVNARIYAAVPLSDKVAFDVAVTKTYQDRGWGRNLALNRDNKLQDFQGVRSKLVIRPTDTVKLTIAGDYYENQDNLALGYKIDPGTLGSAGQSGEVTSGGQRIGWWDSTVNDYPLTRQSVWGVSGTIEADLGFAKLTSVSAYRKTRNNSDFDVDGAALPLLRIAFTSGSKSFQQELRLASSSTEPFGWQVGAFYLHGESTNDSAFTGGALAQAFPELAPGVVSAVGTRSQRILADLKTNSYAVFGEATYAITPTTHLTGGIRYTQDRRHYVGSQYSTLLNGSVVPSGIRLTPSAVLLPVAGVQDSRLGYNQVTWRVALRQDITDDVNVYGSVNRGFKSGSYSLQNPLNEPYLPQFITAYEIGLKAELFDRKLRFNLAGFHYDISNYQVRSAAQSSPGASLVLNAATVKVDGVDLEFQAAPTEGLRLFGGVTWLNSRYGKFGGAGTSFQAPIVYPNANSNVDPLLRTRCIPAAAGTANPGQVGTGPLTGGYTTCFGDVTGLQTMNAPKLTASIGASYKMPVGETGEVRVSALYSYNSGYVFEPDNVAKQPAFGLVNASIEYRPLKNVGIEFWGRNLGNTEYAVQKITTATGVTMSAGAPRTYGVNVNFDF